MLDRVRNILLHTLNLDDERIPASPDTPLLGSIPEFDSMAAIAILTAFEEEFDIEFDDDDVTADSFETLGSLTRLITQRVV